METTKKDRAGQRSIRIMLWFTLTLAAGGYSGWLLLEGFTGKADNAIRVTDRIGIPVQAGKAGKSTGGAITKEEYLKVHRYRLMLDSLALSPGAKAYYDSMRAARPGLLDSLARFEELYFRQSQWR